MFGDSPTASVGVSLKSLLAAAHCVVVDHPTLGGGPTDPGARVAALLVDAGQATGALTGCPALRPAVGRAALMARKAGAEPKVVDHPALGVRPTWIRTAGIHWRRSCLFLSD